MILTLYLFRNKACASLTAQSGSQYLLIFYYLSYRILRDYILDKKDIDSLRVLINDSRSFYRSMGIAMGMSTNAAKTRVKRLVSNGVMRQFSTSIDVAALGYSKLCYLFIRDSKSAEETTSRIKLLGQLVLEVKDIGGTSLVGIAIKKNDEEKIQLLTEALKPALIQNLFIAQS
jgi:DNA-binding Lrp family transcriptional regulator